MPVNVEPLILQGEQGGLEAQLDLPDNSPPTLPSNLSPSLSEANHESIVALVCHPHPLYEGTMLNKVVHTLTRSCNDCGMPALRFNYRGVGSSEGQYGEVVGETNDAAVARAYLLERYHDAQIVLAGFSFGAAVAMRLASDKPPLALITVAPPVGRLGILEQYSIDRPWMVAQGSSDDVVNPQQVREWTSRQRPKPTLEWFNEAGHFFHGRLTELRTRTATFMRSNIGWVGAPEDDPDDGIDKVG